MILAKEQRRFEHDRGLIVQEVLPPTGKHNLG
jgi:hypothetical protein